MKMRKQAGNLRRSLKKKKGGGGAERLLTEENWESRVDEEVEREKRKKGQPSFDAVVDELRRREEGGGSGESLQPAEGMEGDSGIVIAVFSGRCRVFRAGREIDCLLPAEIAAWQQSV